jgi:FkbM family methyltransferase
MLPERLLVLARKRHYLRMLRRSTIRDERDLAVVALLVREGDHVVDLGANFGLYTNFLARIVGVGGWVLSVEPVSSTFEILGYCVQALKLDNVHLANFAISDRNATVDMDIPLGDDGNRNFYRAQIVEGGADSQVRSRRESVRATTLDSLLTDAGGPVSFIKCDVEGHEFLALLGSVETIRRWKPAWLIEVSGDPDVPGTRSEATIAFLAAEGYGVFWFDGTILRRRRGGERSVNYFFLTALHIAELERRDVQLDLTV